MAVPSLRVPSVTMTAEIARRHFGVVGELQQLVGWANHNFLIRAADGRRYVLKLSDAGQTNPRVLDAEAAALQWISARAPDLPCPRVVPTTTGRSIEMVTIDTGEYAVRMLSYLEGEPLAHVRTPARALLETIGRFLGRLDSTLREFSHEGCRRDHVWDLAHALSVIDQHKSSIASIDNRELVERLVSRVRDDFQTCTATARRSVIHGDANDYNILVHRNGSDATFAGLIDFGDIVETCTVFEPAIAAAYAMLNESDPLEAGAQVIRGYHEANPLLQSEMDFLYACVVLRVCVSVSLSAHRSAGEPDEPYLTISEAPAWRLLNQLASVSPYRACETFRAACDVPLSLPNEADATRVAALRTQYVGSNVRLSYGEPIHIVRGSMQYLYDDRNREYLDTVNNVCHVGHCHPRVTRAALQQMRLLNTNTRYLHELLGVYAERLCALFPSPLDVCYFVCSGSEANELALRVARAHTGNHDVIVVDGAYHGNTTTLIHLSPYKHNGPGGAGTPAFVRVAQLPDVYRSAEDPSTEAGAFYAHDVARHAAELVEAHTPPAAFFCESLPSCAGQIVLPNGYLNGAYAAVREAGGICVADEVQVGFGRVGSAFWGFELQGVVPDIVTLGKPMGNGHPLGAVVTTADIARSFDNGMEYFNSFGGNPVSCATGLSVLDVIRDEHLQAHARTVGEYMLDRLNGLRETEQRIGDVRGAGLFIGVELVDDRVTKAPATELAKRVVEAMRKREILASTDGAFRNVLKIKPPLCFTEENADRYVTALEASLEQTV